MMATVNPDLNDVEHLKPNSKSTPNSSFCDFLSAERKLLPALVLTFLPFLGVWIATAKVLSVVAGLAYALLLIAAGYAMIRAAFPVSALVQVEVLVLAPAVGILSGSALSTFWVRCGLPLSWSSLLWLGLSLVGAAALWKDRQIWRNLSIPYAGWLAALSTLICVIYFLPGAWNDAVFRRDGSYNWIYVDTQFFQATVASIKSGFSPPRTPGTFTADLLYHFAPYTPAALLSGIIGVDTGDALARLTRGASIWALVLSSFGVGTLLARRATGKIFGGIMALAGLFFYGSLLALFTNETNTASHVSGAILFKLPDVAVLADGGPFSHLILGHSMLHALVAITAILGLCLFYRERINGIPNWRCSVLILLLAFSVAVNSVASLYCIGIVGILLFWGHLGSWRSWLLIILMLGLFALAWKMMGYGQAQEAAHVIWKDHPVSQWWSVTVAFLFGLGLRTIGFRWVKLSLRDEVSVLVLASVIGLLAFALLFRLDDSNERYGLYYLQCMFSLFAFSRLEPGFWRANQRSKWIKDWAVVGSSGMAVLFAAGFLLGILSFLVHYHPWIAAFPLKVGISFLLLLAFIFLLFDMNRGRTPSTLLTGTLMGLLLFGFAGWIPAWLNFGMDRMRMDITLTPGETQGLLHLKQVAPSRARFATNKHVVDTLASRRERSYGYSALSERPVLLEGYLDHAVQDLPWFQSMLRDNELLFTTTHPEEMRQIAQNWHVQWLVARPGSDIALPRPLPAWLVEQPDSGSLKIYRIE